MPKNINCITIVIAMGGIEKMKTEKNNKTDWRIFFFTHAVRNNKKHSNGSQILISSFHHMIIWILLFIGLFPAG